MSTNSVRLGAILVGSLLLCACVTKPVARMDAYLGPPSQADRTAAREFLRTLPAPLEAGLLLVNDTSAPDSAPALSDEAKRFLTDQVRQRVAEQLPLHVVAVLAAEDVAPAGDPQRLARLGQRQGVEYLLLAMFSGAESEIPIFLPLDGAPEQGGARPKVAGFEAINYALAELALLDVATGQVLLRADGRAWSKLNRLYVPVQSNAYPVIHRSLRIAPIYPSEDNAKDVLRSIAADEALEQAVMHLQESWPAL